MVLKFKVEGKDGVLEEGMQVHHCPPLMKWAWLAIKRHELLPIDTGGQPQGKTAGHAIDQLPFGWSAGQLASQRTLDGFLQNVLYNIIMLYTKYLWLSDLQCVTFRE